MAIHFSILAWRSPWTEEPGGLQSKAKVKSLSRVRLFGLLSTRLLCPWDFPGNNIGVGCHFLLQEIFLIQGLNPGLPHCRQTLYRLSHQGSPGNAMSLLFNMLSRLVIAFLPRRNHLLISWLQSPSAVILEPRKIKFLTVFFVFPSICHEMMGPNTMILVF